MSEKTLTVTPAKARDQERSVLTLPVEGTLEEVPADGRTWFAGAVPGGRPAFRGTKKIGMG